MYSVLHVPHRTAGGAPRKSLREIPHLNYNRLKKEEFLPVNNIDNNKLYIVQVYGNTMDIIKEDIVTGAEVDDTVRVCREFTSWKMITVYDNETKQAVGLVRP